MKELGCYMLRLSLITCFIFWATSVSAQELSPDVQKDMHMLSLAKHLKAKEFEKSWKKIQQLKTLNVELPKHLGYFEGEVACNTKRFLICDKALKTYINAHGTSGRYYKRALELLSDYEEKIQEAKKPFDIGLSFKDCDDCPEMVVIPPGDFMMGSPKSEKKRDKNEGPRHKVTIPKKFAVGKFEVSFEEWDACVKDGGCNGYYPNDQGWGRGNRPVINVNWDDAKAYVRWLSRKTNKTYRLLSEAEWEYVARAKTDTPFWWGKSISTIQANYDGNYFYNGSYGKYRQKTVPVDSFKANKFGLYNVHGNVWEWVEDCWHESYRGAPNNGKAWTKGGDCEKRVLRGGSWDDLPEDLRSADRGRNSAVGRNYSSGFRVSRTLVTQGR